MPPCAYADSNGAGHAPPYDTLETLQCNLSTFKDCDFFRVEVRLFLPRAGLSAATDGTSAVQKLHTQHLPQRHVALLLRSLCKNQVQAIFRPWRLDHVVSALSKQGIMGMTAYQVTGHGVQGGAPGWLPICQGACR